MSTRWQIWGDYFENCNCNVVCPCLISVNAPLTSPPTQGVCDVALLFHVEDGTFGDVPLKGLNVALIAHTPGPMGNGNWTVAAYLDERSDERQSEALGAIFTGAAGGPMAAFAPLIATQLGVKKAPIAYRVDGKKRFVEIPGIMQMGVRALASMRDEEIWASTGHPVNPERLAFAVGAERSTYADYGMRWDNSGKNGHYAPFRWSVT